MDMLKGVAVVIDNGIGEEENINKIIAKVRDKGIPTSEFKTLDSAEKCVHNFLAVNFIILDWKMSPTDTEAPIGVQAGQELVADTKQKNIEFIKKLKTYCFAPIFIFTNEVAADIESDILAKLRQAGLYFDQEGKDYIYVRNKNDVLQDDKLFTEIDQWINKTPSIYLLKVWDKEFHQAKNEIFWDLYNKSNGCWPKVLWEHYEKEEEVPHIGINEVIFQLILSKASLQALEKDKITKWSKNPDIKEIKDIFKRLMFQDGGLDGVVPGDIFKDGDKYYLNIRPECDTVQGRPGCDDTIYLICGAKVPDEDLRNHKKLQYNETSGLAPKVIDDYIWLLDDGLVKFSFKNFEVKKFSDIKDKRICRLLPPYITNIQQRFSSFLGRFGIPRLPECIEKDILKITTGTTT